MWYKALGRRGAGHQALVQWDEGGVGRAAAHNRLLKNMAAGAPTQLGPVAPG